MIFGYARVSTNEQNLNLQIDAFLKEGIKDKNIYSDKVSSTKDNRKNLSKLLDSVREGDISVVWKLYQLERSLIHFTNFINQMNEKRVKFRSVTESFLDTTYESSHLQFIVNMFAALAQLERDIIIERTKAGLESTGRRGKVLGASKGISKKNQQKAALCEEHFNEGKLTIIEICERLEISRDIYYKYLGYCGLSRYLRPYKKQSQFSPFQ